MENVFRILVSKLGVLQGTMEQRPNVVFTCVVLHNMLRTHQDRADREPTSGNDVAALQNEQVVYMPKENYRNPSREAKLQQKLLKDYFNHVRAYVGQEDRIWDGSYPGGRRSWHLSVLFRTTFSSFQDYSINPRTFINVVLHKYPKISKTNPIHFKQFLIFFQSKSQVPC